MAEGWSRSEVAATVADYFDMLDQELRGLDYNKSEHRRRLAGRLASSTALANLVRGKMSIGEHGFIAMIVDTEGNMIGLHSMQ